MSARYSGQPCASSSAQTIAVNAEDRPHREVDAGRDDDERLAHRDDAEDGHLPADVLQIIDAQKNGGADGEVCSEDQDDAEQAQSEHQIPPAGDERSALSELAVPEGGATTAGGRRLCVQPRCESFPESAVDAGHGEPCEPTVSGIIRSLSG